MDDILIMSTIQKEINSFKQQLKKHFKFSDNLKFESILGIKITTHNTKTFISQNQYCKNILQKFNYQNINTKSTPMENKLLIEEITTNINYELTKKFQEMIGSLLYLMIHTRPDISFAITRLSQFNKNANSTLIQHAKRIFQYINKTKDYGIYVDPSDKMILKGYCDASYAEHNSNKKSISGYVFFLDDTPISWKTQTQKNIAKSTMEAELYSIESAISEAIWLRNILEELNFKQLTTEIFCDNQAAILFSTDQIRNARNKHINVKYFYAKEKIENKEIKLTYISTKDMIADGLTKPLSKNLFNKFINDLNILQIKKECCN